MTESNEHPRLPEKRAGLSDRMYSVLWKDFRFLWVPAASGTICIFYMAWQTFPGPGMLSESDVSRVSIIFYILLAPQLILAMGSLAIAPFALIILLVVRTKKVLVITVFLILMSLCFRTGIIIGDTIRINNLQRLTVKLKPLIGAIDKYHAEKGEYPVNLSVLVPGFIASLPDVNMIGYSGYKYLQHDQAAPSAAYQILINCGAHYSLNSDYLIYWHRKNYPDEPYELWGGTVGKIGKWALVYNADRLRVYNE